MEIERLSPNDPNSYSNPDEAVVTHLHLSLSVDFKKTILVGKVILTVAKRKEEARFLILDSKDLKIHEVRNNSTGEPMKFKIDKSKIPNFGDKFEISLPYNKESCMISILYETSPNASALQWLSPRQTAGGKQPYLFSQCQAIHCRSMIPCQDTPSVKSTYSAEITIPMGLVVLMSAVREREPELLECGCLVCYKFLQSIPIPSYLIALAVGALESRTLGPRSQVWCEKEFIEQAAYEFAETEKMLSTAEEICGPYVWGTYDLLVLPPSFPFGGMENPCITFVTPTLLAGDRSLADVVAHEISHSWTGNLVTNRNFEHFWLNEGFTMFVERKILGKMNGHDTRLFSAFTGLKDLADTIKDRVANDPLTCLVVDLQGVDPDDSFSVVPYEKGHAFLYYLEELVGGPERFDPFLRDYLEKFKFKSIDTDEFKKFLYEYFSTNEKLKEVNWSAWLHTPGMPPVIPNYATSLAEACSELCQKWVNWSEDGTCSFSNRDINSLSALQVREFLAQLLLEDPLSVKKLEVMESVYHFNSVSNSEIRFRWLRLCIRGKWKVQIDAALKFVTEQGRMKFVRPIYRDLYAWKDAQEKAIENYLTHKHCMMHVLAYTLSNDLHLSS